MTYGYEGEEEYIPTPEELAALDSAPETMSVFGAEITPVRLGLLIGGFGLVLVLAFALLRLRPKLTEMQTVDENIESQSRLLETANAQIENLSDIQDRIGQARQVNEAISALLPDPQAVETQLLEVDRLVSQNSVQLQSFVPGAFEAATGSDVPAAIQSQLRRSRTRVVVESNSYSQGINLMNSIERLETLFRVSDLSMQINPTDNSQRTEFNLDAFVFDGSQPAVAAPPQEES